MQSNTFSFHYKIWYRESASHDYNLINQVSYGSLHCLFTDLYTYLFDRPASTLNGIKITGFYPLPIINYQLIMRNNALVMVSDASDTMRISSISPQHMATDMALCKLYQRSGLSYKQSKDTAGQHSPRRSSSVKSNLARARASANIHVPMNPTLKPIRTEREVVPEPAQLDPKHRIFQSDKQAYTKIKKDIQDGIFSFECIAPFFVNKYQILKILEARNVIDFASDNNIEEEYKEFQSMLDVDTEATKPTNVARFDVQAEKVYVPHNYFYRANDDADENVHLSDLNDIMDAKAVLDSDDEDLDE